MGKDEARPLRPDFLNSAKDILGKLSEGDEAGRKSKAEPGPRKVERHESIHGIGYTQVDEREEAVGKRRVAISLDVASHGVGLKTSTPLNAGDLLMLDIHVRNQRTIYALGEVIHCRELKDGTFKIGIKFLDISEKDYQFLLKLLP